MSDVQIFIPIFLWPKNWLSVASLEELVSQLERIEELRPGTARKLKEAVRSIGLLEVRPSKWQQLQKHRGLELGQSGEDFHLTFFGCFKENIVENKPCSFGQNLLLGWVETGNFA